jgi:hypothetical protein
MSSSRPKPRSAMAILGAALLALLTLDGCSEGRPQPPAPPPMASAPPPATSPELMGGPAAQPATAQQAAAEQPAASQQTFTPMAPIANPEDMAPQERVQVYGHHYDRLEGRRHGRFIWGRYSRRHSVRYSISNGHRAGHGHAIHHRFARHGRWRYGARRHHLHHAYAISGSGAAQTASHRQGTAPAAGTAPSAQPPAPAASSSPPAAAPATPAPEPVAPATQAGSPSLDWLSIPGRPYVYLPGFGRVASKFITAAGLLLLAIILLAVAAGRGRTVTPRRRPVRSTVGAGPAFADEPRAEPAHTETAPVAPFPHHESDDPTLPPS